MKVYRELTIRGGRTRLDEFIHEVERRLTAGWVRDHGLEDKFARGPAVAMYCFTCTRKNDRPACELWLRAGAGGELDVSNIIPQEQPALSHDEYNRVVEEFYDRFARPAALTVEVQIHLGNPEERIEDYLSPESARLLRAFAGLANRWGLHPLDRKRWNEFLTAAYREHATLEPRTLRRYLIEEERWPEEPAGQLALEYENGRKLLDVYQSQES